MKTQKKEKIALAVRSFSGGGAERVMVTLANKFHEWGYGVDFIVGRDEGPYKKMLRPGINKISLTKNGEGRILKKVNFFLRLRAYLSHSSATSLMSTMRKFNVKVLLSAIFLNKKPNIFIREADTLDRPTSTKNINNAIFLWKMWCFYPKATKVIANSEITKKDLLEQVKLNPSFVKVIYNPLNIPNCNQSNIHSKEPEAKKIIACGRLISKKNFADLIKAMPILKQNYPHIKLYILGQGPEEENLKKLIQEMSLEDCVSLEGFQDDPFSYYASADVFVQTSLWEGFGYVLAEAMACGTPVVAYDSKGAMREILADGKYGKLTTVGDLNALAHAISEQIENPTPRALLDEAVAHYDVDYIANQYLEMLLGGGQ